MKFIFYFLFYVLSIFADKQIQSNNAEKSVNSKEQAKEVMNLSFASGAVGGTYEKIALSLNSLENTGLKINNITTNGSYDNIKQVLEKKADIGIVQMDILLDIYKKNPKIEQELKILLPLYKEELQIITKEKMTSLKQLSGKKIAIGPEFSGISGTSKILIENSQLNVESIFQDSKSSLRDLLEDKLQAVFLVSGVPTDLLLNYDLSGGQKFFLMNLDQATKDMFINSGYHYKPAEISKGKYTWLDYDVYSISVISTMVVRVDMDYKKVEKILVTIFDNKTNLTKVHYKWNELNLPQMVYYFVGRRNDFHLKALEILLAKLTNK